MTDQLKEIRGRVEQRANWDAFENALREVFQKSADWAQKEIEKQRISPNAENDND